MIFKLGAISNWLVTIPAILFPDFTATILGLDIGGSGAFLMRIWAGMAFLWGWMFWEISRNLRDHRRMIKYSWLEKTVTATSVTIGFFQGSVGWLCFGMVLYTDYLWIPLFIYYDIRTRDGAREVEALDEARRVRQDA